MEVALADGKLEIAKTLIKYGADVDSRDNLGWTPLHRAAYCGHVDVLRQLLDNGADINATEWEDFTPLHLASVNNRVDVVQSLLEQGANVQIRNVYGRTPYQDALKRRHRGIAQLLSGYEIGGV